MFYVIDGLLDVSMPSPEDSSSSASKGKGVGDRDRDRDKEKEKERGRNRATRQERTSGQSRYSGYFPSTSSSVQDQSFRGPVDGESTSKKQKHLFTVKPGGIAGYLGK